MSPSDAIWVPRLGMGTKLIELTKLESVSNVAHGKAESGLH